MRKIGVLLAVLSAGLSAKIWVNAIRDPGAELGVGDWTTHTIEYYEGGADSAVVSVHDSIQSFEGRFSFLTDTRKYCGVVDGGVQVDCIQKLNVPKAVKDIDSCFWEVMLYDRTELLHTFYFLAKSQGNKHIRWQVGASMPTNNDTFFTVDLPEPDSGVWTSYAVNLPVAWEDNPPNWSPLDTIAEIHLSAWGTAIVRTWYGQKAFWDNVVLRSLAYYDFASMSIDSDVPSGGKYTPIVTFANEGIKDDKDAWVYAEILEGSTRVYVDSQKVSIHKESSKQVTFKEWSVAGGGPFTLRTYPILDLDELSSDDTLEKSLGGIREEGEVSIEPLKISQTSTGVEFSFSPSTSGELSVYDACGRMIFTHLISSGTRELRWSNSDVPSGLYFARFNSPAKTITERFVIIN